MSGSESCHHFFSNQPGDYEDGDDDVDDEDEDEEEEEGPRSMNLAFEGEIASFSLSFLLPVQTDLWAGLNCQVTFFVVAGCSVGVAAVFDTVGFVAMGTPWVAAMLVVTSLTFLALSRGSVGTSGSAVSSSQPSSAGGGLERAELEDLPPEAEFLEERVGSESERSESQSLSPATEPQPYTDTSTGPDPELSESESLKKTQNDIRTTTGFFFKHLLCVVLLYIDRYTHA